MNFWIEGSREALLDLLGRVRILIVNDEEVRELADEANLLKAARWVQERGPEIVVVKKGEHGAILFADDWLFFVPGFPLEEVYDPTGAGDAFAGGFVGYLANRDSLDPSDLRRAMVYGSVMGSFAVERFSVNRLVELPFADVEQRMVSFRDITAFETHVAAAEHV
jgi:sugar/nucleoside kinase (ribokinase family)